MGSEIERLIGAMSRSFYNEYCCIPEFSSLYEVEDLEQEGRLVLWERKITDIDEARKAVFNRFRKLGKRACGRAKKIYIVPENMLADNERATYENKAYGISIEDQEV